MERRAVCWLRRDLRLEDHAALSAATAYGKTLVLFVFDPTILSSLPSTDARVSFIADSLMEVDAGLRARGSALVIRHGDPLDVVPRIASEFAAQTVVAGRDYEPAAIRRDERVQVALTEKGIAFETVRDHLILEPGDVLTATGAPFSVFTPFHKVWMREFDPNRVVEQCWSAEGLASAHELGGFVSDFSLQEIGFERVESWLPGGEAAGKRRLEHFEERIDAYGLDRDIPSIDGTSALSPYFRFGCISVASAVRSAQNAGGLGAEKWMSELVWREFYQHVLAHWPSVAERAFRRECESIEWPGDPEHFDSWKSGKTGFPIVDAAMRCLGGTGWLHNRLRMVVASFLVKDLLLDYRWGEQYFAAKLLDYELASNNGGWQWSASTGCDAQPYFRIFNPRRQSEKFDPNGDFIRKWVPELAGFDAKAIHCPQEASPFEQMAAGCRIGSDYPFPIVDHAIQSRLAKDLFRSVFASNALN